MGAEAFIVRNPLAAEARIYTSVEDMAADPEVDAVYIGTPNYTVLCEKPLAVNAEEGRKMIEAAKVNGTLLMKALISTLNPNFRAYEALQRGELHKLETSAGLSDVCGTANCSASRRPS